MVMSNGKSLFMNSTVSISLIVIHTWNSFPLCHLVLTKAVESNSVAETQRIVSEITLARLVAELADARKVASRTSGARGKKAREEEIKAEARVKKAEEEYVS